MPRSSSSDPFRPTSDISRRSVLQSAVALGALGYGAGAEAAQQAAIAIQQHSQTSKPMTHYIGTPTSRVDGRAKVTGAAKYAAEFNAPDLAYGSVVGATIAKGRITGIDASEALAVAGVLDVLTHTEPSADGGQGSRLQG